MNIAVQRRLGGTSNLWGGRCVPLDALDFEPRPVLNDSTWPITGADLTPFLPAACEYLGCGPAVFEKPIPGLENVDASFRVDHLERWSSRPILGKSYLPELSKSAGWLYACSPQWLDSSLMTTAPCVKSTFAVQRAQKLPSGSGMWF